MSETLSLYPHIEPYNQGFIEVDEHKIYFEECGNPNGKPAVFLHGGPGGGGSTSVRKFFNPDSYRIIVFDQRGCGIALKDRNIFSVQYHPEASPGPTDSLYLFKQFINIL